MLDGVTRTSTNPRPAPEPPSSSAVAMRVLQDNSQSGRRDLAGVRRDLDSLNASNPPLASAVTREVNARLTPVERGQLARLSDQAAVQRSTPGPSTATLVADLSQLALDITGIVDPTPISDGGNALISVGRAVGSLFSGEGKEALGHLGNGALSVAGILPYLGDAAKLGKIGKWAQTVADATSAVARNPALRGALEPALRQIHDAVNAIPQGALDKLPGSARQSLENMKTQLDEFFGAGARSVDNLPPARPQIVMNSGKKGDWPPELNSKKLQPDTDYLVNGYTYRTDAQGRVTSAEGTLDLRTAERNGYQQTKAGRDDRLGDDQGGHLIASIFNGPGDRLNLVAMNGNLNQGAWKKLENQLADALKNGKTVDVQVSVQYGAVGERPTKFIVDYVIDGTPATQVFRNRAGG